MNERSAANSDWTVYKSADDRESIHITQDNGIGINVDGSVIVKPLREWHALARPARVSDEMVEAAFAVLRERSTNREITSLSEVGDWLREGVRKALVAASLSGGEVRVKKLEWRKSGKSSWSASALGLEYVIQRRSEIGDVTFGCWVTHGYGIADYVEGGWSRIAPVKMAAQADYEQRIKSALESVS